MSGKVLFSSGAYIGRWNGRDFHIINEIAKKLCADGTELMLYTDWYGKEREVAETVKGLSVPVLHIEKTLSERLNTEGQRESAFDMFRRNCEAAVLVGAKALVFHLWNGELSDRNIDVNIDAYGRFKAIADSYNLLLTVENVICNTSDPITHFLRLIDEYGDVSFTVDTKFLQFHRQLEELCSGYDRIWSRVKHIHLNDYSGGLMDWENLRTQHIGRGLVDFQRFFEKLREIKYTGDFTLECTSMSAAGIDFKSMEESTEKAREYISRFLLRRAMP